MPRLRVRTFSHAFQRRLCSTPGQLHDGPHATLLSRIQAKCLERVARPRKVGRGARRSASDRAGWVSSAGVPNRTSTTGHDHVQRGWSRARMDSATSVTPEERRRTLEQIARRGRRVHALSAARRVARWPCPVRATPRRKSSSSARAPATTRTSRAGRSSAPPARCSTTCCARSAGSARRFSSPTSSSAGRPRTATRSRPRSRPARRTSKRQLEVLDPAVVVTLGRHSLGYFNPGERISGAHGTVRPTDPETGARNAVTLRDVPPGRGAAPGQPQADHARGHVQAARGADRVTQRARCSRADARDGGCTSAISR